MTSYGIWPITICGANAAGTRSKPPPWFMKFTCDSTDRTALNGRDRAHFFAVAARMMRRILVDYSRRHRSEKRGGSPFRGQFGDALTIPVPEQVDLIELDSAMEELATFDARKCQVVEMRFFTGLRAKEIAVVLNTTEATVRRDWIIARAWLYRYLEGQATR
jgi:RNA polymerase sigma factor (TIGR02999 family)